MDPDPHETDDSVVSVGLDHYLHFPFLTAEQSARVMEALSEPPPRHKPQPPLIAAMPGWDDSGFTVAERDAWMAAGLRSREFAIAKACEAAGLLPEHLSLVIDGWSIVERLRSGESARALAASARTETA